MSEEGVRPAKSCKTALPKEESTVIEAGRAAGWRSEMGVSAAVIGAGVAPPVVAVQRRAADEEPTEFNVILTDAGGHLIQAIKVVKEFHPGVLRRQSANH